MCFMGWIYEILAIVAALLSAKIGYTIQEFNIPNIHFPDVILMFVIIPFIHLLNDEDTKHIIFEQGWIQGIKYVLGIYKDYKSIEDVASSGTIQNSGEDINTKQRTISPMIANLTTSQRRIILRKCKSAIEMVSKDVFLLPMEKMYLERYYSLKQDAFPYSHRLVPNEKKSVLRKTLARCDSTEIAENEIQTNISTDSCHSSLSIIYIDN